MSLKHIPTWTQFSSRRIYNVGLANLAELKDNRTFYEEKTLEGQGELRKHRPCVVVGAAREAGENTHYLLCPMAGFHEEGWQLSAVIQSFRRTSITPCETSPKTNP